MQPSISVIICTHNPRHDYIEKVLQALSIQTLPIYKWELLLIDNSSDRVLANEIDLSWHPHARHIQEEKLGLTPARLRGIQEAQAEVLVFVDDDNVLDSDYLEIALQISRSSPFIGAWGGQIRPEFEETPPEWTKAYWWMLALKEFDQDKWSNLPDCWNTIPCGAGLCVRSNVANRYAKLLIQEPKRLNLDRKGKSLTSCGDLDLALTSHDFGLGTGEFTNLKLTHLMPKKRLREEYLLKLAEANGYSKILMETIRGKVPTLPKPSWRSKLYEYYRFWQMHPRERCFHNARKRGEILAIREILLN